MITLTDIKKNAVALGLSLLLMGLGQSNTHALTLPDVPLTSFSNVEHNVLLTFDDSGSMAWGYIPDTISGIGNTRRACSSQVNGVYYDPTAIYNPPVNADGSPRNATPTSFGAAYRNGYDTTAGTVNLATGYQPSWSNLTAYVSCGFTGATTTSSTTGNYTTARNAFYFTYNGSACGLDTNNACYTLVQHNNAGAGGTWSAAQQQNFANWYSYYRNRNLAAKTAAGLAFQGFGTNVRIAGQHLNNTTAGTGTTIKFTNTTSTNATNVLKRFCDDPTNSDSLCIDGSTARTEFYTRLYNSPASGMTPLLAAMQRAGVSFGTGNTGTYSPYRDVPGVAPTAANPNLELSCRKNFHIMMTDGYWNGATGVAGDIDGVGHTLGDGITTYAPQPPYSDSWSGSLADNSFYYWYQDLRPDLTNNVKAYEADPTGTASQKYWNHVNNPATWQHMQNFTIGLGITGNRNPANYLNTALPASAGDWDELKSGALPWPDPTDAENGDRIDDLWHAAINSRGSYFDARNPAALTSAFNKIVGQINKNAGSGAGLGASGGTAAGGTSIYQVLYETSAWTGRLIARTVDANGLPTSVAWEAGTGITGGTGTPGLNSLDSSSRNIFTYNPSTGLGVPFAWGDLSAAQQTALNLDPSNVPDGKGEERLNYLRGASTNEGPGNPTNANSLNFRVRTCYEPATVTSLTPDAKASCDPDVGKLGDIINSSPVYVRKPVSAYPDNLEGLKYSSFVAAQASRQGMIYVGANDGMLHGFRESDGKEMMAYVPNMVYANATNPNNLSLLTSPSYSHRYYVDGTPTVGDVFINGAWRTMLVGGLRKGGRGYFALDITDPNNFTQNTGNAQQLVKWEFTDTDLGYSYSQATIIKMANGPGGKGRWAAVFGNGYNNTGTGRAMLYVVDIETGALIKKIDTGTCANAPCGGGTVANPNGLGTVTVVDLNDDYIADYIYAGDLLGKLWRFDVRSEDPAKWGLAANVTSVFTAVDSTGVVQPITTPPSVGFHPLGFGGLMVYFGTGKYLESTDNTTGGTQQTQTFYGIYDRGVSGRKATPSQVALVTRADLLQQTISAGSPVTRLAGPEGDAVTFDTRNISNNPITYRLNQVATAGTYLGWYVNLPTSGERQVTASLLRESRIIFTTLIPSADACNPGGTGWLMELNAENGGQLAETLDLNGDGAFTGADNPSQTTSGAAGAKVSGGDGSLSTPVVLTMPSTAPPPGGGPCTERKLSQSTTGDILPIKETCKPAGRTSWRQLR